MAKEYKITLGQVSGGNFVPVTSGNYSLYNGTYTYTDDISTSGVLDFGTVVDGWYKLKVTGGADVANFGERYIGDDTPTLGNTVIAAGSTLSVDTIQEITSAAGVTIDGVTIKDGDVLVDVITEKTSAAGVTIETVLLKDGKGTFTAGLDTNVNTSGTGATNRPKMVYSDGYSAPVADAEYAEKKYVDDSVATVIATPYQESAQKVRVIVNGTAVANQIYTTIAGAVASFSSPLVTKQCLVEITDTGNASQYIYN